MWRGLTLLQVSLCLALVSSVQCSSSPVLAEEALCGVDRPWVLMDLVGLEASFGERMLSDLRAGLAPSRIEACVDAPVQRKPPLATVRIARANEASQSYSIDVSDSVTQKRIGRDVELSHVPPDGRAFALAVAAEELLRASWAELALSKEKPREKPPPEPAPRRVEPPAPPLAPSEAVHAALGLGVGLETYTGGQTHFGVDLFWLAPLSRSLSLGITLGARQGLSVESANGSIGAVAMALEVSIRPVLLESSLVRLDAVLGLRGAEVWFRPEPSDAARGTTMESQTLFGRGGFALAIGRPGSVRSLSQVGAGGPLRSFSAADGGEVVTGVSGAEFFATSGVALEF